MLNETHITYNLKTDMHVLMILTVWWNVDNVNWKNKLKLTIWFAIDTKISYKNN